MRDTAAAKRLLFRRLKALHAYESANRALEKARAKNKDVHAVSILCQTHYCNHIIVIFVTNGLLQSPNIVYIYIYIYICICICIYCISN